MNVTKIKSNKHKIGDLVLARVDDCKGYVLGIICEIINYEYGIRYRIDWNNGLCEDANYTAEAINTYKKLLRQKKSC